MYRYYYRSPRRNKREMVAKAFYRSSTLQDIALWVRNASDYDPEVTGSTPPRHHRHHFFPSWVHPHSNFTAVSETDRPHHVQHILRRMDSPPADEIRGAAAAAATTAASLASPSPSTPAPPVTKQRDRTTPSWKQQPSGGGIVRMSYTSTLNGVGPGGLSHKDTLSNIVAHATQHNPELGITACIFLDPRTYRIVQSIEGHADAVDALAAYIETDARHEQYRVIERVLGTKRTYAGWNLKVVTRAELCESGGQVMTDLFEGLENESEGAGGRLPPRRSSSGSMVGSAIGSLASSFTGHARKATQVMSGMARRATNRAARAQKDAPLLFPSPNDNGPPRRSSGTGKGKGKVEGTGTRSVQRRASIKRRASITSKLPGLRPLSRQVFPEEPADNSFVDKLEPQYPMLVMRVTTLLGLPTLLAHQEMLQRRLLLPYNKETMAGRVIFVSHQVRANGVVRLSVLIS